MSMVVHLDKFRRDKYRSPRILEYFFTLGHFDRRDIYRSFFTRF